MNRSEVFEGIRRSLQRIILEKGEAEIDILENTRILGSKLPIDSLDLATLVIELQTLTGKDPFVNGFIEFQTAGELADLFCDV